MMIHEITALVGKNKARKRVGRGRSSGQGKTSGRGHKGAGSRSGYSIKAHFEGGQMPFYRRIPIRGFSNARFKVHFHVINIRSLESSFNDGAKVNADALFSAGLIRDVNLPIKILGDGDVTKKLDVVVNKISATAKSKIEAAGGQVEVVEWRKKWTRSESKTNDSKELSSNKSGESNKD